MPLIQTDKPIYYIHTDSLSWPITAADIRAANPNTSFPYPFVLPDGYAYVFPSPQPAYNPVTQSARETTPELTAPGLWEQRWEVVELFQTQEERDAAIAADTKARRSQLWTAIKAIRDTKIQTGGYQAAGKWFHSDTFSRTQQMALVMMGASVPAIQWKTMDGSFVTMTPALAGAIFQAAAAHDAATFGHAEALRAQVDAATDPATIDIHTGWPATFVASPESPA